MVKSSSTETYAGPSCGVCGAGKAIFEIDGCEVCVVCYRNEQFCQICGREILPTENTRYDSEKKANHPACLLEGLTLEMALAEIARCGGKLGSLLFGSDEEVLEETKIKKLLDELSGPRWSDELLSRGKKRKKK